MKKKRRLLLLIVILLIALVALILVAKSKKNNTSVNRDENTIEQANVEVTPSELDRLKEMSEKERIIYYFNKYIKSIENKDYKQAYNMLYDEFKNTYFKTIEQYEKYIDEKYPEIIAIDYNGFQRQGIYYVMTLEFQDILKDESFTQMFVLREYGYNDFKLSFQAE